MSRDESGPSYSFWGFVGAGVLWVGLVGVVWLAWSLLVTGGGQPAASGEGLWLWYLPFAVAVLAHELGHLAGGRPAGLRLVTFAVAPFRLTRWRLCASGQTLGQCWMIADDARDLRRRNLLLFAGGPLLGLSVAILACAVIALGSAAALAGGKTAGVSGLVVLTALLFGLWMALGCAAAVFAARRALTSRRNAV